MSETSRGERALLGGAGLTSEHLGQGQTKSENARGAQTQEITASDAVAESSVDCATASHPLANT